MKISYLFRLLSFLAVIAFMPLIAYESSATDSPDEQMNQGTESFNKGHFAEAIRKWEDALKLYEKTRNTAGQIDALSHQAKAYQSLGRYEKAGEILRLAEAMAQETGDRMRLAMIMEGLGQVCQFTGQFDQAEHCLKTSLKMLKKTETPGRVASVLNSFGNLLTAKKDYDGAVLAYNECRELSEQSGNLFLSLKAGVGEASVRYEKKAYHQTLALLRRSLEISGELGDTHDHAYALIAAGQLLRRLRDADADADSEISDDAVFMLAYESFRQAAAMAERLDDHISASYALGEMGNLYEKQGRYEEALDLTRRAVFAAQKVNETKSLYRWHHQTGRILNAMGDTDGAIAAYLRSAEGIRTVRKSLSEDCTTRNTRRSFRETVGPVYFELADLLLRRSSQRQNPDDLLRAREIIEQLKAVELEDYFEDECAAAVQTRITDVDRIISPHTAAIYPILLPDRTELLVNFPDQMLKQFTVPIRAESLTADIREFRTQLEDAGKPYLALAQKLYDCLIRPLEDDLNARETNTLVFIPDGELRTIPLGAFHDGEKFLISSYAIATCPGLTLTAPGPLERENIRLLLNGLTEPVQGFPPLPYVSSELNAIQGLYKDCKILKNREFTLPSVKAELERTPYTVVHMASHGQFDRDLDKTFLLTYDGRLTMDALESFMAVSRFREKPVELLCLSACQTAAGDDRAALGLAGIALKAGARSALASLWFINDRATSELVADFYRQQTENPSLSKAKALQYAQTALLKTPRYQDPAYWAPFLLIGNWL